MDYQGNYFRDDDEDEYRFKSTKIIKNIFKYILYGLSFLVWAILIYLLIANRDRSLLEENYMTEIENVTISDKNDALIRINPPEFMNYDGSTQIFNADYSYEYGLLEIGVKYNVNAYKTKLEGGTETEMEPEFILTDNNGTVYPVEYVKTETGGRYSFNRICFSGLAIDLKSSEDYSVMSENHKSLLENSGGNAGLSYTLSFYDKNYIGTERTPLETFLIYDGDVRIYFTDYNKG